MSEVPRPMKIKNPNPCAGIASVLMVFLVLCLTLFGVLSLSSARSDWDLTRKNRESVLNCYAADARAQQVLRQIDGKLRQAGPGASARLPQLFDGRTVEGVKLSAGSSREISFTVPAGRFQQLEVSVRPGSSGRGYRVTRYRFAASAAWDGDDRRLNVWQGQSSREGGAQP